MTLSDIAIKRPVFITMVSLGLFVMGLLSFQRLGIDLYPDVSFPVVNIVVPYPGAPPADVERQIVKPVEDAVVAINGVDRVVSFARDNAGIVVVQFKMSADIETAANEVREKVDAVVGKLPSGAEKPIFSKADIGAAPVMTYAAFAPMPSEEVRRITEDFVKPALEQVEGVAKVDVLGGRQREIQVDLDATALERYRLSPMQVVQKLTAENMTIPAGRYNTGTGTSSEREVGVRTLGELSSLEEIRNALVYAGPNGQSVRVSDVAAVVDGFKEQRQIIRANGLDAVAFDVVKTSGANTVKVADEVKRVLDTLQLPKGYETRLLIDQSSFIKENAHEVEIALVYGGAMAILIILFFMMDLRSTLISAIALPTAVVGTFFMMWAMDFTLNMLTLLGLSLAIGLLIDDAVVVRENIFRHLEKGEDPDVAASKGTSEIALAVLATTLTVVAVFLPVAFMTGMVGQFFKQFGFTVSAAVLLSMFVAFTLDPMLSARLARKLKPGEVHGQGEATGLSGAVKRRLGRVFDAQDRAYARMLGWSVRHPFLVVAGALTILAGSVGLAGKVGLDFVTPEDRGQFILNLEYPAATSLAESSRRTLEVERALLQDPRFKVVYTIVGYNEEVNTARLRVDVGPKTEREEGVASLKALGREIASRAEGGTVFAEDPPLIEGLGAWLPIMISISGPDYDVLEPTARKVEALLRATEGASDVKLDHQPPKAELRVVPDRDLAARAGLPMALIGMNVRLAMEGERAGTLRDATLRGDERETDIRVRLRPEDRQSAEAIARIPLSVESPTPMVLLPSAPVPVAGVNTGPRVVRIGDIAEIETGFAPSQIRRENRERRVLVTAAPLDRSLGELYQEIKPKVEALIPPGYSVSWLGNVKDMNETNDSFGLAFGMAILFIYLVLASQFESFVHPLTIMVSLPLAVVGAIVGIYLYGVPLSMGSFIGIIFLMGLVTKNAILLVDSALVLQREGKSAREAILEAGPRRLRPIIMTSAAMVLGMVPTAISQGPGSEFRAPMATAIIGGVISSTVLTLIVVPVVFLGVEALRGLFRRLLGRDTPPLPAPGPVLGALLLAAVGATTLFPAHAGAQARTVTLTEAHAAALSGNPDLAVVRARVALASVDVKRAWAYFLPQLTVGGELLMYDEEQTLKFELPPQFAGIELPETKLTENPTLNWQATLLVPLLNLPGFSSLDAARAGERAAEQTEAATREQLLLGVSAAYVSVLVADGLLVAGEESVRNAAELVRVARAQVEAQVTTELSLLRAQVAEADAKRQVIDAQSARESALAALRRVTGLEGELAVVAVPVDETELDRWLAANEGTLVEAARRQRPDLAAAEAVLSARASLDEATWHRYSPTVAARAQWQSTSNEGLTGDGTTGTVGLVAEWKLYDGGLREAETDTQRLERRAAEAQRDSLLATLREELSRARSDLRKARAGREVARQAVELSGKAQRLAQVSYQAGTVTNLEVTQANAALFQSRATLAQAESGTALAALNLRRALGESLTR
jgi:hydrophobe/amphiphile efflux-1 (HAE1) family protein